MSEGTPLRTYPRRGKNLTNTAAMSGGATIGARPVEDQEDRRRKKGLEERGRIASPEEEDAVGVKAADAALDESGVKCASRRLSSWSNEDIGFGTIGKDWARRMMCLRARCSS